MSNKYKSVSISFAIQLASRVPSSKAIQAYSECAQCSARPWPSSALPSIFSYWDLALGRSPRSSITCN